MLLSLIVITCESANVTSNTRHQQYFDYYEMTVFYQCNLGFHLQCPVSGSQSRAAEACSSRYQIGLFMQFLKSYFC